MILMKIVLLSADAVGHSLPMPLAASGFWMSKNRYRNQTQVLEVARGFKARGLPLSVLVIDYLHWVSLGDDSFNPHCFPDVPAMVAELNSMNVTPVVSFYAYFNKGSANYDRFVKGGMVALNQNRSPNGFNGCLGALSCKLDITNSLIRRRYCV